MAKKDLIIVDLIGLHARPASLTTNIASKQPCDVKIFYKDKFANMKSIMGVLSLGIPIKAIITIETNGDQADEALKAIVDYLVENKIAELAEKPKLKLLDFSADWCKASMTNKQHLDELLTDDSIEYERINVDFEENYEILTKYQVSDVPTLILLKGEEIVGRLDGLKDKEELEKFIKQ